MATKWMRPVRLAFLAAVTASVIDPSSASAQTWPSRPVTMVVAFAAGTTSDIIARGLAQYLSDTLGQSFVIDNRAGAGGNIGAESVARAPQDGYRLLFATTGQAATNKLMYENMPYDPERDFAPIALVGKSPVLITARADAPFSTLKEMIDYAKANPDKLNGGFPGNGTLGHITGILLQSTAGIKFSTVQYRGAAAIITDLIGKNIDIAMDSMGALSRPSRAGRSRHWRWPVRSGGRSSPMSQPFQNPAFQALKRQSGTRCWHRLAPRST